MNFWNNFKKTKPFFALAPMADVTDFVFRQIISKYSKHGTENGGPDIFWTEFVSADGLCHPKGREKLLIDLKFNNNELPIVAQIFGSNPENLRDASRLCYELGFSGVDINMGCPDKTIEKQGAGAAMIKNKEHALKCIKSCIEGASGLPVSVKTRLGYNKVEFDEWIPDLLKSGISALTIHARTRKEMSDVPANWEYIKKAVELRDEIAPDVLIIGNGDVSTLEQGRARFHETGCDGVMIGRGIFGNPWLFDQNGEEVCTKQKLEVMLEHTKLFWDKYRDIKNFAIMKKHYKAYVNNFDGAKELRVKLMECTTYDEIENITLNFISNHL